VSFYENIAVCEFIVNDFGKVGFLAQKSSVVIEGTNIFFPQILAVLRFLSY